MDSDSTHNFINSNIITKVELEPIVIVPFEVKVSIGDKLNSEGLEKEVKMNVQWVRIVVDLHVLPLAGLDVILGNAWLKDFENVVHDYHNMTMEFNFGSKKRV